MTKQNKKETTSGFDPALYDAICISEDQLYSVFRHLSSKGFSSEEIKKQEFFKGLQREFQDKISCVLLRLQEDINE